MKTKEQIEDLAKEYAEGEYPNDRNTHMMATHSAFVKGYEQAQKNALEDVERLKLENADLKERIDKYWKECDRFESENEKLKEAAAVLVETLVDIRSEMTRSESQINHDWCIDQCCTALKQYSEMMASEN